MRSSVSVMLSAGSSETVVARPDWKQGAQHHACLLLLVRGLGTPLKNFSKLFDRIQKINNVKITDSSGHVRDIWVRYVRDHPVENNDWGDFQTHRRLLGLITIGKYNNQIELNEICRIHESLKVKYSSTIFDSRALFFGPGKTPRDASLCEDVPDIFEEKTLNDQSLSSVSDGSASLPCDVSDSLSSIDSFQRPSSLGVGSSIGDDQSFTTPSNFKTRATFYNENDPCADLEKNLEEFISSLFWILESKRLERSREKLEKVSLILAPFERKDIIGLDMESRNNKRRNMGRMTKHLADLTLQAGLVYECLSLYHSAAEILRGVNDWLWLASAYEGLCAATSIILYPNLRNPQSLQRNASLQEGSPNKLRSLTMYQKNSELSRQNINTSPLKITQPSSPISVHSDHTPPSSSESIDTSSKLSLTDNPESDSLASSSDLESQHNKLALPLEPGVNRQSSINSQFILSEEEIAKKYREAIIYYSNYKNAGIIETEAIFKAARISVEQNNSLQAANFLQNVILINLNMTEQEKIQRFDTLSEMYEEIGFLRKAAFCQRLAATRQVSPNNPSPDWQRCYSLMLHSFPGHKLSLDPNSVVQHQIGWPALQIQLLQELVVAARRMGHPALATRHMTFLLQTMWPHLTLQERRDFAIQLQALSAQCEGGPVPLVLECGQVIPPANLTQIPPCTKFIIRPPVPTRSSHPRTATQIIQGPFLFTPIHFGSLDRKQKKPNSKMDFLWVENDTCEVHLKLTNPLPFELKVSNMRLLTSGVVFESIPETVILQPDTPTTVILLGTPKEHGQLDILGYSTHTLGVKSNCRLKHMPESNKFLPMYSVDIIPSLPILAMETSLPPSCTFSTLPNYENVIASANVTLYNGESTDCVITITNTSDVPVEFIDVSMQTTLDNQLQARLFQWSAEDIQSQLPIPPSGTLTFTLHIYADADFLDIGGTGVDLGFPSLTSNSMIPSRVNSPIPNQNNSLSQTNNSSLPYTSSSYPTRNHLSSSFRSNASHSTGWSAPISVLPPTKGRQIDAQLLVRYSGGEGKETYCRQGALHISMELLPSVSITHWDVLPAEIPSQLYLVLDVSNLTNGEMALQYSEGRRMLLGAGETCRVPVPLDRCPLNLSLPQSNQDSEPRSITTNSSNTIEQVCSEHISRQVDLRWHLLQDDIYGKASVRGITLSQAMLDIVRMSPLNWEVSVNNEFIKPQEEYSCVAGERISLGVAVSNHLDRPLKKLSLSVEFYQDYQNGVNNYRLDNRVATAGTNKVILPVLKESGKIYHECSAVFLTPGVYKVDIQCSTSEPVEENTYIPHPDNSILNYSMENPQPTMVEVNHVWRFIPPVAISVGE